jgi:VCBS repeat-containing protein
VIGTGEPGATVEVRSQAGALIGTGSVDQDGNYTAALVPPQTNGEALTVTQADVAGNVSGPTTALAPDITAPDAPTAVIDETGTVVSGTGEPDAIIIITDPAGTEIGTGTVDSDGTYTVNLVPPQDNGELIEVTQTDAAGNESDPATVTAPDLTAPDAPADLAVNDDGTVVTGTGEPGATVEITDEAGAVIGTGTVGDDGNFSVNLVTPQISGETLSATQTDAAGNESLPGTVVAPFDIDAFDNSDTAQVDLVPSTSDVDHGSANYLALVSLAGLDLQVLAIPNVQFTVEQGHSLDALFEYDSLLNIGVATNYVVAIQQWDGTQWVSLDGAGEVSLLEVGLLDGNVTASETLGPGLYRAFLTFEGGVGLGLLGSLNVGGVDSDFTDPAQVIPGPAEGNVITDPNTAGEVDIVSPQTTVQSVTVNGATTQVTADGTVIDGAFGTLVINLDGSYAYTPDADASVIGQIEVFQYTLVDGSDGETETATLTITINSDDVTAPPVANDDGATAAVEYQNVVETIDPASAFNFTTPAVVLFPQTGSGSGSFTIAANTTSDITIAAVREGGLSLLPSYTITVFDSAGAEVGSITGTALASLPLLGLGAGLALSLEDLAAGDYTYTISSTNSLLGTGYATTAFLGQEITFLDQFEVANTAIVEGNVLDNDVTGSLFTSIQVDTGAGFTDVGDTPVVITGLYGTLTINEGGDYVYQPSATLPYSTVDLVDSFTYQLVQPGGQTETGTLDVTIDVSGAGIAEMSAGSMLFSLAPDDMVGLGALVPDLSGHERFDGSIEQLAYAMFEGQGSVEDVLSKYLGESAEDSPLGQSDSAKISMTPEVQDPLGYLALPDNDDLNGSGLNGNHMV